MPCTILVSFLKSFRYTLEALFHCSSNSCFNPDLPLLLFACTHGTQVQLWWWAAFCVLYHTFRATFDICATHSSWKVDIWTDNFSLLTEELPRSKTLSLSALYKISRWRKLLFFTLARLKWPISCWWFGSSLLVEATGLSEFKASVCLVLLSFSAWLPTMVCSLYRSLSQIRLLFAYAFLFAFCFMALHFTHALGPLQKHFATGTRFLLTLLPRFCRACRALRELYLAHFSFPPPPCQHTSRPAARTP